MLLFSVVYGTFLGRVGRSLARGSALIGLGLRRKLLLVVAFCSLLSATIPAQSRHESGGVAVVANRDLPVANLSLYEVRRLFLGETRYWKSNLPVVLIVPPTGSHERDVMLHSVYRMNEAQYKQYWIGRILRGEAISAPKTAESLSVARDLVASLPGCVTIMNINDVDTSSSIRVLKVDGKSPGDKEYPLR